MAFNGLRWEARRTSQPRRRPRDEAVPPGGRERSRSVSVVFVRATASAGTPATNSSNQTRPRACLSRARGPGKATLLRVAL